MAGFISDQFIRNKQQFLDCVTWARFNTDGAEKDNIGKEYYAMNCGGKRITSVPCVVCFKR